MKNKTINDITYAQVYEDIVYIIQGNNTVKLTLKELLSLQQSVK